MRRIVLAAVAVAALGVAAPTTALARHHGHHQHGKHSRHHAKGAHVLRFGAMAPASGSGDGITPSDAGAQGSAEPIGTIKSFENNVLTIELTDKELVKGAVSSDTRIACRSESAATTSGGDDQDAEGDSADGAQGQDSGGGQQGDGQWSGDQAHASDTSGGWGEDSTTPCEASVLTQPTTKVLGAELRLTGAGAEWEWLVVSVP